MLPISHWAKHVSHCSIEAPEFRPTKTHAKQDAVSLLSGQAPDIGDIGEIAQIFPVDDD